MESLLSCSVNGAARVDVKVNRLTIASWTGRNREQLARRISELEAMGVKTPASIPCTYNVSHTLLTTDGVIDVVGGRSTGEVEAVLIHDERQGLLVGVGSDHTDREVESYNVAVSKQLCGKPIGLDMWKYEDVANHWDELIARSWVVRHNDTPVLYQEGKLENLLPVGQLLESIYGVEEVPRGTAVFCGTQTVIGKLEPARLFEMELFDPVLGRSLRHKYEVHVLEN